MNHPLQTPQVKLEKNGSIDLPYPTPDLSPDELKLQQQKYARLVGTPNHHHQDWSKPPITPTPLGPETSAPKEEPSLVESVEKTETESYWDQDSSFEVSSNLISEIHQKYGDDYLGSAEFQNLEQDNGMSGANDPAKQLDLMYQEDLSWHHGETYEASESKTLDLNENDYMPLQETAAEEPKPIKRRAAPPGKRKNTRIKKSHGSKSGIRRWTESDDDKVAFLREYGNLKWHEVTEFINGRHTPQAVQMRYLRSLKRRNDTLTMAEEGKLRRLVVEDYESRFKRISTQMGPSFTPIRIQKLFLEDAGMGELLKAEKVWTKEEISKFVDEAAGDFDSFVVPYRADKLPPKAAAHMEKHMTHSYKDLINLYVGSLSDNSIIR